MQDRASDPAAETAAVRQWAGLIKQQATRIKRRHKWAVAVSYDDLEAAGRWGVVWAVRTHDPQYGSFGTHVYSCVTTAMHNWAQSARLGEPRLHVRGTSQYRYLHRATLPEREDEGTENSDFLQDPGAGAEDVIAAGQLAQKIRAIAVAVGSKMEQKSRAQPGQVVGVITYRLIADEPETLDSLGARFGVSKEAVRQTENRILRRLKRTEELQRLYNDLRD